MKKQFVSLVLLGTVAALNAETVTPVHTNLKIGFVSSSSLLNDSKFGKQIQNEVKDKFDSISNELQSDEQNLVKSSNELIAKKSILSTEAFEAQENKLKKSAFNLQAKKQEKEEEFKTFSQKKQVEVANTLYQIASDVGPHDGYDALIDKDSGRVVWNDAKNDCTGKLLAALDKKFEQKTKVASNSTKVASTSTKKSA